MCQKQIIAPQGGGQLESMLKINVQYIILHCTAYYNRARFKNPPDFILYRSKGFVQVTFSTKVSQGIHMFIYMHMNITLFT